jgi:hypothetical protein
VSPIKELPRPNDCISSETGWVVLAYNSRVNKSWEELMEKYPKQTLKCYEHLHMHPMQRIPGSAFPLRHPKYQKAGAWEYELPNGNRIFYVPRLEERTVIVYYAGEHPPKGQAPFPPK